ncbi:alpha/beta hydrolase family protein [Chloroflexota bacterium]
MSNASLANLGDGEQQVFFRAGGQWCYLWTPTTFRRDRPLPVVIHHHGYGGYVREGGADWLEEDYKIAIVRSVMAAAEGCAVAGSHACGDHCGNPDGVTANRALFEVLVQAPFIDASRIGLMGGGMGGALVWNSVLGPLAARVKAVAVLQSVASLEAFIRAHKHKWMCLQAYGLPESASDDEAVAVVAPYDPLPRLQQLPYGSPLPQTAIYHGAIDEDVILGTHALPLAEALSNAGSQVTLEVFPDVDHSVYMMGEPIESRLTQFFSRAL